MEFYKIRLFIAAIAPFALAFFVAFYTVMEKLVTGGETLLLGIDILFTLIITLTIAIPISLLLAPALAFILQRAHLVLKLVVYIGVSAGIAYSLSSGLDSDLITFFGGLGGAIFCIMEVYVPKFMLANPERFRSY